MLGRLPHRRSPPPPPLISRHSPGRIGIRSPGRQHLEMASSGRGRERREYRPSVRRSRSPIPPKRRSYSPPIKRKASPIADREIPRRPKISKSPVGSRGGSRGAPELRYSTPAVEPDPRPVRNVSSSERFREREYEEDREGGVPQFRGPEGSVDFDINELKKFTIEIVRKPSSNHGDSSINRNIINPDDIAPVRRPDTYERDYRYFDKGREKGMRGGIEGQKFRGHYSNRGNFHVRGHFNNHYSPTPKWKNNQEEESFAYNSQNEGSRPLFLRAEASSSKDRPRSDDYQRIVAIDNSRGSGHNRPHSRERPPPRYSPGPSNYEDNRRPYYNERERGHSPYEARHRSPNRDEYVEPRDKHRERRGGSREDLRRDLDVRKREERRYSPERRLSYERDQRESDLRSRINEKRSDPHPHPRIEDRERERRYEGERERVERPGRPHHSSPPRERRRPASPERHEGSRDRREAWERDREREGRDRDGRRRHSREREPRDHSDHHYEESRRPTTSHKSDYEPKKFYKNYEAKEFVPPPVRGRGLPMRRGVPPIMRGRGIVRGMSRGFRGGVMVPRGMPRGGPFIPRGFPPRFFPPY